MKKFVGYMIAVIGILGLAVSTPTLKLRAYAPLDLIPKAFTDSSLMIISLVIVVVGVAFAYRSESGKQPAEVPIYHGKHIVGFRRMGK